MFNDCQCKSTFKSKTKYLSKFVHVIVLQYWRFTCVITIPRLKNYCISAVPVCWVWGNLPLHSALFMLMQQIWLIKFPQMFISKSKLFLIGGRRTNILINMKILRVSNCEDLYKRETWTEQLYQDCIDHLIWFLIEIFLGFSWEIHWGSGRWSWTIR